MAETLSCGRKIECFISSTTIPVAGVLLLAPFLSLAPTTTPSRAVSVFDGIAFFFFFFPRALPRSAAPLAHGEFVSDGPASFRRGVSRWSGGFPSGVPVDIMSPNGKLACPIVWPLANSPRYSRKKGRGRDRPGSCHQGHREGEHPLCSEASARGVSSQRRLETRRLPFLHDADPL